MVHMPLEKEATSLREERRGCLCSLAGAGSSKRARRLDVKGAALPAPTACRQEASLWNGEGVRPLLVLRVAHGLLLPQCTEGHMLRP